MAYFGIEEKAFALRLFVGLELPEDLREELIKLSEPFKEEIKTARFIPARNVHLTVKFLGSFDERALGSLEDGLKRELAPVEAFEYILNGLGAFPSAGRARILWLGTEGATDSFANVYRAVDLATEPLGYPGEKRPFHPHITLARIKIPQDIKSIVTSEHGKTVQGRSVSVKAVTIFQSVLHRTGAEYTPLNRIHLK